MNVVEVILVMVEVGASTSAVFLLSGGRYMDGSKHSTAPAVETSSCREVVFICVSAPLYVSTEWVYREDSGTCYTKMEHGDFENQFSSAVAACESMGKCVYV